jgi:S-adenosylmethionine:tRNA ribosyltransferase-isomerase
LSVLLADYDFDLPSNLIAQTPIEPRSNAKLLVYDRKSDGVTQSIAANLCDFLPQNYAVIFNDSKVIKARLLGKKISGGRVEALITRETKDGVLTLIKGKVRAKTRLLFDRDLSAEVLSADDNGTRLLKFYESNEAITFSRLVEIAEQIGKTPLPPYIKREANDRDANRYQSCFAKVFGSVAAPTASLHFDPPLLERVRSRYKWAEITLHIGLGTFKGIETNDIRDHKMHFERYEIGDDAKTLIDSNAPILAIGTTAARAIEYYARTRQISGECDLFLYPNNPPRRVSALLTNFHLPRSTLFTLVCSLVGVEKAKELYKLAIANNYRFYSYGDAMLIL